MRHKYSLFDVTTIILPLFSPVSSIYSDDLESRLPTWLKTEKHNDEFRYFDDATKTQKFEESWKDSKAIRLSENNLQKLVSELRQLQNDPEGTQAPIDDDGNLKSKKVWDYVDFGWYRDGDLFVMPVGDVINDLMRDDDNLDYTYRWFKDRTTEKPAFEKKEQDWMITYRVVLLKCQF